MIRKKIILADHDERYLKEIRCEFMEKAPQINLITFTGREKLYQYLEHGGTADILIVDEGFVEEKLKNLSASMSRIALSFSMNPIEDFEVVKKYQRMETLLDTILLKYAQDSGSLETIRGDSNTRIAVFYSPAGGTGKTALAVALAAAGARAGFRTLYLNLEEIDSVKEILNQTPGCLTDVFLALKTNGMQAGIKLKESLGKEPNGGFYYISGVESISEYEEVDGSDIRKLVDSVRELSIHDLAILDLSSGFTEKTGQVLMAADVIFMPVTNEEGSMTKLQRFVRESNFHPEYDALFEKTNLIINKTGAGSGEAAQLPESIGIRLSCCTNIGALPVLSKLGSILRAGDILLPLMEPVLQKAMPERCETYR